MAAEAGFGSGTAVVAAMAAGDSRAADVFDRWCREVARGLANLVVVLDSRRIVLGGGLVEVGEPLRLGVTSWLARLMPGDGSRPAVEVLLAELGSDAGALGAGLLAGDLLADDD
jgi:glucokinase